MLHRVITHSITVRRSIDINYWDGDDLDEVGPHSVIDAINIECIPEQDARELFQKIKILMETLNASTVQEAPSETCTTAETDRGSETRPSKTK